MSLDFKNQQIEVSGFDDLFKKMDELKNEIGPAKTDSIWRKAMLFAMEPVLQDAKSFAPKDTGQLADHIYMKAHKPQSRDQASKYYDGEQYMARVTVSPIRENSQLRVVLNKRGRFQNVWAKKRPVGISQEFGNARTPWHPFMRPALSNNIDRVQSRLAQSIWEAIDKLATKG